MKCLLAPVLFLVGCGTFGRSVSPECRRRIERCLAQCRAGDTTVSQGRSFGNDVRSPCEKTCDALCY